MDVVIVTKLSQVRDILNFSWECILVKKKTTNAITGYVRVFSRWIIWNILDKWNHINAKISYTYLKMHGRLHTGEKMSKYNHCSVWEKNHRIPFGKAYNYAIRRIVVKNLKVCSMWKNFCKELPSDKT